MLKKPPSLRSHRGLFSRAKQSSSSSGKSLLEIHNLVDPKAEFHKQQKPQEHLPSLHRRRKSNPNLCCPAGTPQSQSLLSEAFLPPLDTAQLSHAGSTGTVFLARQKIIPTPQMQLEMILLYKTGVLTERGYHYKAIVPVAIICLNTFVT